MSTRRVGKEEEGQATPAAAASNMLMDDGHVGCTKWCETPLPTMVSLRHLCRLPSVPASFKRRLGFGWCRNCPRIRNPSRPPCHDMLRLLGRPAVCPASEMSSQSGSDHPLDSVVTCTSIGNPASPAKYGTANHASGGESIVY